MSDTREYLEKRRNYWMNKCFMYERALVLIQMDIDDGTVASLDTINFKVQDYVDRAEKELKEATDE